MGAAVGLAIISEWRRWVGIVCRFTVGLDLVGATDGREIVDPAPGFGKKLGSGIFHTGTGHAGTGHAGTGHAGTGHAGTGHAGTGHAGTGHTVQASPRQPVLCTLASFSPSCIVWRLRCMMHTVHRATCMQRRSAQALCKIASWVMIT